MCVRPVRSTLPSGGTTADAGVCVTDVNPSGIIISDEFDRKSDFICQPLGK